MPQIVFLPWQVRKSCCLQVSNLSRWDPGHFCPPAQWLPASAIARRWSPTAGSGICGKYSNIAKEALAYTTRIAASVLNMICDAKSTPGRKTICVMTLSFGKCNRKSLTRGKLWTKNTIWKRKCKNMNIQRNNRDPFPSKSFEAHKNLVRLSL